MAVITINGKEFPAPDLGANLVVATNVSDGKNALGEFVGQKVGRDQYKFDSSSGNFWMLPHGQPFSRNLIAMWYRPGSRICT